MATVSYVADRVAPSSDRKLDEIAAMAVLTARAIKLRLQPDLYNFDKQHYDSWTGAAWTLDLEDAAEARKFLEGLRCYMAAFGDGPEKQKQVLEMLGGLG